jgi:hypothetical protein
VYIVTGYSTVEEYVLYIGERGELMSRSYRQPPGAKWMHGVERLADPIIANQMQMYCKYW